VWDWGGPYVTCIAFERSNHGNQIISGEVQIEIVRGRYAAPLLLTLVLEAPDGATTQLVGMPHVIGCHGATDAGLAYRPLTFDAKLEGTYWVQVCLGPRMLGKTPIY